MSDLVAFYMARLDEVAEAADGVHRWEGGAQLTFDHVAAYGYDQCTCGWPRWLLAEVEAKRRIVMAHAHEHECVNSDGERTANDAGEWPCQTLRLLVLPYAGHPAYDESWRP